jgi:hypothetical protein
MLFKMILFFFVTSVVVPKQNFIHHDRNDWTKVKICDQGQDEEEREEEEEIAA